MTADLYVLFNDALVDCEVCEFLDQLVTGPSSATVSVNVADSCTPVPSNCP
ncbi:MAG: hypothetical protein JRF63_10940 [Deltaproteobacteria bacterium]|nr:hypothetical protein [Deltaproteobacteria bacterium]